MLQQQWGWRKGRRKRKRDLVLPHFPGFYDRPLDIYTILKWTMFGIFFSPHSLRFLKLCVRVHTGAYRGQKRVAEPLELVRDRHKTGMWVLGSEPRSSTRAAKGPQLLSCLTCPWLLFLLWQSSWQSNFRRIHLGSQLKKRQFICCGAEGVTECIYWQGLWLGSSRLHRPGGQREGSD